MLPPGPLPLRSPTPDPADPPDAGCEAARTARALTTTSRACWEWTPATDRLWLSPEAQQYFPGPTAWRTLDGLLTPLAAMERTGLRTACLVQAIAGPTARPFQCVMRWVDADQASRAIEWRGAAYDDPDTGRRVVSGTWTDVTYRVRAGDMRQGWRTRLREAQIREAARVADAVRRTQQLALAQLAHDVRTPLNAIVGLTALALDRLPDEPGLARVREFLQRSDDSARALTRIIDRGFGETPAAIAG